MGPCSSPLPVCVTPPVLYTPARVGLMHIGVFILLLLSGERNFGVRLNKPYSVRVPMDIPVFTGTHADLLIVVRGCAWSALGIGVTFSSWLDLEVVGNSGRPLSPCTGIPQNHHQRSSAVATPLRLPAHHCGQR